MTTEVAVKNRFTHDEVGHPYTFSEGRDGELLCNGCGAETWLCMAKNIVADHLRGERSEAELRAACSYIAKGLACIANSRTDR